MNHNKSKKLICDSFLYTVGMVVYLFSQWLISVVIVNVTGLEDAGYFGLAMTISSVFFILANYGIRSYQISDIKNVYSNSVYVYSRLFTTLLGFVLCVAFSLIARYDKKQFIIIVVYMLFKCFESIYDVYHGILQKNDRLSDVGIMLTIKGIVSFAAFCVPYIITKNVIVALVYMMVLAFIMLIFDILYTHRRLHFGLCEMPKSDIVFKFLKATLFMMLIICSTPLFATIPRIILDKTQSKEILGIYTSLATPAVLISTFANTAFLPLIPKNVEAYEKGDKKSVRKMLVIPSIILLGISLVASIAVALIGHWAFNLVYGEIVAEHYKYMYGFIANIVLLSITIVLNNFCTGIRKLKQEFLFMAIGCVLCLILSLILVPMYSMLGAIIAMIIAQSAKLIMLIFYINSLIKKI